MSRPHPVAVFVVLAALVVGGFAFAGGRIDRTAQLGPGIGKDGRPTNPFGASEIPDASVRVPPEPALERFYTQALEWDVCQKGYDCTSLKVPLDYAKPKGRVIELSVLRVPSSGQLGPLVVNPGGPGVSGVEFAASARQVLGKPVLRNFEIIGFDPRGTAGSAPVTCVREKDLADFYPADPDPDDPAEVASFTRWTERMASGCAALSGGVAGHVTTVEAARDMDVLRAALGQERMNYYGASYGTKLGAMYAELFPEKVGRFILDGGLDVTLAHEELLLGQAAGFETALRAFVNYCIKLDDCALGDSVDAGVQRIRAFLEQGETSPLRPYGIPLTRVHVFNAITHSLYLRQFWPPLAEALTEAADGNGEDLLWLSANFEPLDNAKKPADNSDAAFYAIGCLDDPSAVEPADVPALVPRFEEASPTFGRTFAWMTTSCRAWKAKAAEPAPEIRAEGAAPIIVVGTTRDPATPYEWSVTLADQLESGVLISREGDGHTGYDVGSQCVDLAVENYLIWGEVPQDGLECQSGKVEPGKIGKIKDRDKNKPR